MRPRHLSFAGLVLVAALVGCGPSEEQIQETIVAELTAQAPAATNTTIPTRTPRPSPTPTITFTPTQRPTKTPTPTPVPGTYQNPLGVGDSITVKFPIFGDEMGMTLLEYVRGDEAQALAKSTLDWITYDDPVEGQEYLAVRFRLVDPTDQINADTVSVLYPYWHVTLRRDETSSDIWSLDFSEQWAEGFPPLKGEGWRFFLVREGVQYFLYFHPNLIVAEEFGVRTGGAFFELPDDE